MTSSSKDITGGSTPPAATSAKRRRNRIAVPLLRKWHHTLGAVLAALLVVVAFTGTLLVYKDQILRHTVAAHGPAPAVYAVDDLAQDLDGILLRYGHDGIGYLKAPNEVRPFWTLVDAAGDSRLLAPRTLEELDRFPWLLGFFDFVRALHVDLMLHTAGDVTLFILGLIMVFFAVSGLIMWWPARRHFRLAKLLPRRFNRQQLLISHRQLGLVAAPLLVLSAVTGSVMLGNGLVRLLLSPPAGPPPPVVERTDDTGYLPPGQLLQAAHWTLPDGQLTLVRFADARDQRAQFRMRLPGEWHPNGRTRVLVDAETGAVAPVRRADQAPAGQRLLHQMYPLHSAYGLPALFRFLVFAGGAITLWLAISGGISWLKRQRRPRRSDKS